MNSGPRSPQLFSPRTRRTRSAHTGAGAAHRASRSQRIRVEAVVDHSELPSDNDVRELMGPVTAPIYYRFLVTREPLDHAFADRAATTGSIAVHAGASRLQ
ncbi:TetR/AcrR family transcriptional regulator C-terminal ligand-binding domain-containing protein [Nocardia sp. R16R-3T]